MYLPLETDVVTGSIDVEELRSARGGAVSFAHGRPPVPA
jgi:hypothetical protein